MSKKKENKTNVTRRNFLTSMTCASAVASMSPVELLFSNMIQGICDEAQAAETGASGIVNYIHLSMSGGPARWMFDLPVMPNGSTDLFGANQMLITKMDNPTSYDASYATFVRNGLHFPHIWSLFVPKASGGIRPMTDLLDHMICFRGMNLLVDGHGQNRIKQNAPVAGLPSLTGLVADKADTPFPSVYYDNSLGFISKSGIGAIRTSSGNPINTLLSPFDIDGAKSFGRRDAVESMVNRAIASLKEAGQGKHKKNQGLFNDRVNAKKLFEREFGNLTDVYNDLYQKYEKLISDTMTLSLPGISDKEIAVQRNNHFRMQTNGGSGVYNLNQGHDLRDTLVSGGVTQGSAGASISGQNNTTIQNLARNMALAEYIMTQKLSTTVTLNIGSLANLYFQAFDSGSAVELKNRISNNDQHASGKFTTMFFNTFYYCAISACMLELFDQLKKVDLGNGKNMFENTVLHLTSEFNRSARSDGTGSDHGWNGSTASLFSGMIKKAEIIGNIKAQPTGYRGGSWGVAGANDDLGGREMLIGNVASSVSSLLNIESPTPNDASFLGVSNGTVVNYASKPKNV